jgi:hypothetical protein
MSMVLQNALADSNGRPPLYEQGPVLDDLGDEVPGRPVLEHVFQPLEFAVADASRVELFALCVESGACGTLVDLGFRRGNR